MKINFTYCFMFPWRQCERCFIGPSVLYDGDDIRLSIGLFFVEIGITLKRTRNEPDS
jgi:hypothetical protein